MQGKYTQALSDIMWEQSSIDPFMDDDYQSVLSILNSNAFRPFSVRLLSFLNQFWNTEYSSENAAKELLRMAKQNNVPMNRNTILNWFSGKSMPNMGISSRERMYAVAFALKLSPEATEVLFQKVMLDRAYNPRNIMEFVYRYCLSTQRSYGDAQKLLNQAKAILTNLGTSSEICETQKLEDAEFSNMNEEDILVTIEQYRNNFVLSDVRAKKEVDNLLQKVRGSFALEEYRLHHQSENIDRDLLGRDTDSLDFLLFVIKDQELLSKKTKGMPSLPDLFPVEIANDFPDKSTFSLKDPSSYILRKEIIFLFFYYYWASNAISKSNNLENGDLFDEFKDNLNDRLESCGLSTLYAGNPYDWMFLYCSCAADDTLSPLDIFRGMLAKIEDVAEH